MPAARALRYARSGSTVTPRFDLGQCHAAPGNSGRRRPPQLARRPQPGAGRPHFAFPATTASAAGAPRTRAQGRPASVGPCRRDTDTPASAGERGSRAHSRHRTRVSSAAGALRTGTRALALGRKAGAGSATPCPAVFPLDAGLTGALLLARCREWPGLGVSLAFAATGNSASTRPDAAQFVLHPSASEQSGRRTPRPGLTSHLPSATACPVVLGRWGWTYALTGCLAVNGNRNGTIAVPWRWGGPGSDVSRFRPGRAGCRPAGVRRRTEAAERDQHASDRDPVVAD
jgi:hypothetical protein